MKTVIFYIGPVNDDTLLQYLRIRQGLPNNYKVFWCLNKALVTDKTTKIQNENNITFITYQDNCINKNAYVVDMYSMFTNILLDNPTAYQTYDYYYIIEAETYYTGNYSTLFKKMESSDADLLASYIKKIKPTDWMWSNKYVGDPVLSKDGNLKQLVKCCLYFFRISHDALMHIIQYDSSDIKQSINELYYPTLLYNAGFKLQSLSSDDREDDEEFRGYTLTNPDVFYCNVSYDNTKDMDNYALEHAEDYVFYKYNSIKSKSITTNQIEVIGENPNPNPAISVIMPAYNAQLYIIDAVNSILRNTFTDFELIIINDGSEDNTKDIISEYPIIDKRVIIINKKHSGIVNSLNVGIDNAKGKYILRMDADDLAMPTRLQVQYDYMETHLDVDICGGSMTYINDPNHPLILNFPNITMEMLLGGNRISHPTVIMRKTSLDKLPYLYEQYYNHAEDYKLWFTALSRGLKLVSIPDIVILYRTHQGLVTSLHYAEMMVSTERIKHIYNQRYINNFKHDLTAIIPFKNEGEEIEKTVASIRATTTNLRILLIDDGSVDGYDYNFIAKYYNCDIIHNKQSKGVAGARDQAVGVLKTPYFILFDGHMRFYDQDWDETFVNDIKEHPNCIIFAQTSTISKYKNLYDNEHGAEHSVNYGSYINMDEPGWEYTAKWTHRPYYEDIDKRLIRVPCCLGATYCTSKEHWLKIGGLKGLTTYGQDEPLMSIKTWLAGGDILVYKDLFIGHIYREKQPYPVPSEKLNSNSILLNHLFAESDEKIKEYDEGLKKRIGEYCFKKSMDIFKTYDWFDSFKEHFYKDVAVRNIKDYYAFNRKCYY